MKVSRKEMTGHQLAHQGQLFRATNSEKDQNSLTGTFIPGSLSSYHKRPNSYSVTK